MFCIRTLLALVLLSVLWPGSGWAQTVQDSVRMDLTLHTENGRDAEGRAYCSASILATWPNVLQDLLGSEDRSYGYRDYGRVATEGMYIPYGYGEIGGLPEGIVGHNPQLNGGGFSFGAGGPPANCSGHIRGLTARLAGAWGFLNARPFRITEWYATFRVPDGTPIALFQWEQTDGLAVAFDASFESEQSREVDASAPENKRPVASYAWDFGDGRTGTGARPVHTYDEAGEYVVTLTVTDDDGETAERDETVRVEASRLQVTVETSQPEASVGDTLTFVATITNTGTETIYDLRTLRQFVHVPRYPEEFNVSGVQFGAPTLQPEEEPEGTSVELLVDDLAPGASIEVQRRYVVTRAGGVREGWSGPYTLIPSEITSTLETVTAKTAEGEAVTGRDGCADEGACPNVTEILMPEADLRYELSLERLTEAAGKGSPADESPLVVVGDSVLMRIRVENTGELPLETIRLPEGEADIEILSEPASALVFARGDRVLIDRLEPGETGELLYVHEAVHAVQNVGVLVGEVEAEAVWPDGKRDRISDIVTTCSIGEEGGKDWLREDDEKKPSEGCGSLDIAGEALIVTTTGDEPNPPASMTDGICDVDRSEDGLQCTLRAALMLANEEAEAVPIRFDISEGGTPRIVLTEDLDPVTATVQIDGTTQPGLIEIDFTAAPLGLWLNGSGSDVRGLALLGGGLDVNGEAITVVGNQFGFDWAGIASPETVSIDGFAIEVFGAGARIGAEGGINKIVHATGGISVAGDDSGVVNNEIGDAAREAGVVQGGVYVAGSGVRVVGNVIRHAGAEGIVVDRGATDALLTSNTVVAAGSDGIRVEAGASVVLGAVDEGNMLDANGGWGIAVGPGASESSSGVVEIKSNVTSDNEAGGIWVSGVTDVRIGGASEGPDPGRGNYVYDGLHLTNADGAVIHGNVITDTRDDPAWPLYVSGTGVRVGGLGAGEGNTLRGTDALRAARQSTLLIDGAGVWVEGNTVDADDRGYVGVTITGADARVRGNTIQWHDEAGVLVAAGGAVVGGPRVSAICEGPCNVMVNNGAGVHVDPGGAGTQILGNHIGVDESGAETGNAVGVVVLADDVVIGGPGSALAGTCEGPCNVISGNGSFGIQAFDIDAGGSIASGSGAHRLTVQGNFIGQTAGSLVGNGVGIALGGGGSGATIGGRVGEADGTRGNVIAGNYGAGVEVHGSDAHGNTIRGNRFIATIGRGIPIDLIPATGEEGATPNDLDDADDGPNGLINWPTLVHSQRDSEAEAKLLLYWTGSRAAAARSYRIDVYASPACRGWSAEADVRAASRTVSFPRADAPLDTATVRVPFDAARPFYGATITDSDGNTSEFGNCLRAHGDGAPELIALGGDAPAEVAGLWLELRDGASGAGKGQTELTTFVGLYRPNPASDTLFVPGAAAVAAGGATIEPEGVTSPAWRLAGGMLPEGHVLDVCLPVAPLDATRADAALVVARGAETDGRWQPYDTTLEVRDGRRYACAAGIGVLGGVAIALPAESITVAREHERTVSVPKAFTLDAAYPNPFNPQATIGYALPEPAAVRLAVYDALGREVAVLVDAARPAGRHTAVFEAGDLPSGLYLYRLTADGQVRTGRMLLVK